jgi:hypothetical protein
VHIEITINAPMIYTAPVRNVFDAGRYITWASGRGLGPGNGEFLGLGNGIEPVGECHLGPKKLESGGLWYTRRTSCEGLRSTHS